jgi:D-glycero-alpha-D-manno-heptose 1-phosphate guanylyltransferase
MQDINKILQTKEAIILCGGLGNRLRSVVSDRPKPMADFNGKPFLDILIRRLASLGIEKVILSTGYMSEIIEENLHAWSNITDVVIVKENELLGTGGAVKNSLSKVNAENFFIINGDSYCQGDIIEMEKQHFDKKAHFTMLLTQVNDASQFGSVVVDTNNKVLKFVEKNREDKQQVKIRLADKLVNAGIYLCSRRALSAFPEQYKFSLEYDVFPKLISHHFYGFITSAPLYDIGTAQSYANAVKVLGNK